MHTCLIVLYFYNTKFNLRLFNTGETPTVLSDMYLADQNVPVTSWIYDCFRTFDVSCLFLFISSPCCHLHTISRLHNAQIYSHLVFLIWRRSIHALQSFLYNEDPRPFTHKYHVISPLEVGGFHQPKITKKKRGEKALRWIMNNKNKWFCFLGR